MMNEQSGNPTVWGAIFLAGLAYETYTLATRRHHATLSATTRVLFRVHDKPGQLAFVATWGVGSVWFLGHILRWWR